MIPSRVDEHALHFNGSLCFLFSVNLFLQVGAIKQA